MRIIGVLISTSFYNIAQNAAHILRTIIMEILPVSNYTSYFHSFIEPVINLVMFLLLVMVLTSILQKMDASQKHQSQQHQHPHATMSDVVDG